LNAILVYGWPKCLTNWPKATGSQYYVCPQFNSIVRIFIWHTAWSYGGSHRQFRFIGNLLFQKDHNWRPYYRFIIFDLLAPLSQLFSNLPTIQLHNWQTVYNFVWRKNYPRTMHAYVQFVMYIILKQYSILDLIIFQCFIY